MYKYRTCVLGTGVRGRTHIKGLIESERFDIVALCDIDSVKMQNVANEFNLDCKLYTDAESMLSEMKPEVFVFLTLPNLRLEMIKLADKYNVKAISLEKPMAESLQEAHEMAEICRKSGIKAVVCHQQKYLSQMQEMKARIDNGEIGEITTIHINTSPWLSQLGTHYIDYALWAAGGAKAKWVMGHAHGTATLEDSHPSPDHILGEFMLENGIKVYLDCGYLSGGHLGEEYADIDNRLTVYGTHGYVWAETDGYWGAFTKETKGELLTGKNPGWYHHQEKQIQTPYYVSYAQWLDDDSKVHDCNIEISYHGYEILEAMCLSALTHTRQDLPLTNFDYKPVFDWMREVLPDIGTKLRTLYDGKKPRKEAD